MLCQVCHNSISRKKTAAWLTSAVFFTRRGRVRKSGKFWGLKISFLLGMHAPEFTLISGPGCTRV